MGKGAGLGRGVEVDAVAVAVTEGDHLAGVDFDSSHLSLEAHSHSAADEQGEVVAWERRTFVRTWFGTALVALAQFARSLSGNDLVAEQHQIWMRTLHLVGRRMHGHNCLADSSGPAGCYSPPCGAKDKSASLL